MNISNVVVASKLQSTKIVITTDFLEEVKSYFKSEDDSFKCQFKIHPELCGDGYVVMEQFMFDDDFVNDMLVLMKHQYLRTMIDANGDPHLRVVYYSNDGKTGEKFPSKHQTDFVSELVNEFGEGVGGQFKIYDVQNAKVHHFHVFPKVEG